MSEIFAHVPWPELLTIALAVAILVLEIVFGFSRRRVYGRLSESLSTAALTLENKAKQETTTVGFIEALLGAAAERQQLSVLTAERRAGNLFRVGTLLMIVSVVVPFILVAMYLQMNPTDVATQLKALGVSPADAAKASQRDWHLLIAGVSFGLLFLAAAKGILAAESKQLELYSNEVRGATYYGDLTRALRIAERLDSDRKDSKHTVTDEVVRKVIVNLLERGQVGHNVTALEENRSGIPLEHEFLKVVADALKKP